MSKETQTFLSKEETHVRDAEVTAYEGVGDMLPFRAMNSPEGVVVEGSEFVEVLVRGVPSLCPIEEGGQDVALVDLEFGLT